MKLAIIFLVILILQGSHQHAPSSRLNELEQVVEEFTEAIRKVQEITNFIGYHLSGLNRDYELKINEIINSESILSLVQNLQNKIQKIESETNMPQNCIDTALRQAMVAIDEIERAVDSCIIRARTVDDKIKSKIYLIVRKDDRVRKNIIGGFHECVSQGEATADKVKCLKDVIEPVKKELDDLEKNVVETHDIVHKEFENGITALNICMKHSKNDFDLKSETILEDLGTCSQHRVLHIKTASPKSIIDIIRELKEKINTILHILGHLPTGINDIQDKINEIISHINISNLVSQIKAEINEIFNDGGANAEKCRPLADQRLEDLIKSSEERSNKCLKQAENQVEEIEASINGLYNESQQILTDIKNQVHECFNQNKLNPIGFYKCLGEHINEFQERVNNLQTRVNETYNNAKDQAELIIKDLASCVNTIQMDTVKEGQSIIKEIEQCVLTSHFRYMM